MKWYDKFVKPLESLQCIKVTPMDEGIIICGDSQEVCEAWVSAGVLVDAVITDPPWIPPAISYIDVNRYGRALKIRQWGDIQMLVSSIEVHVNNLKGIMKENGAMMLFCGDISSAAFMKVCYEYFKFTSLLCWAKNSGRVTPPFSWKNEYIIYAANKAGNPKTRRSNKLITFEPTFYAKSVSPKQRLHPAQKPLDLIKDLLYIVSSKGDVVLDIFAGSGVVAEACTMLGRKFIIIEINSEYCDRIVDRVRNSNFYKNDSSISLHIGNSSK